jgi:hypothetical protein
LVEAPGDLAAFYNYPLLCRLLESSDTAALTEMRGRLAHTNQGLERIVRQGTKDDAARAARVTRAYKVTFALLDELEQLRAKGSRLGWSNFAGH